MPATASPARNTPVPTPISRKQNPVVFASANTPVPVKLFKTMVYRYVTVELTGQLTIAGASNTQANLQMGDEWAALTSLDIAANGSDHLRNFSGDDLWWLNFLWFGQAPATTAALGDGATANPSFDSQLVLPFWKPRAYRPFDTALDSGRFNDLQLTANFAAPASVMTGATYAANPQLSILSHEQLLPKNAADQPQINWVVKKYVNLPGGVNNSFVIPLDAGVSYDSFIINIKNTTGTADAGSGVFATAPSTCVNNVQVVGAGGRVYYDGPWIDLVQGYRSRAGIPQTATRRSTSSNHGAWGVIDLCRDGYLTEAMPNPNDARLILNVGAACQVNVIASQLFPIGG